MFVRDVIMSSILCVFLCFVPTFALDDANLVAVGTLQHSEQTIVFDIGSRRVGSEFVLNLTIKNQTGRDLSLKLNPTCGCTEVKPSEVQVKKGDEFRLAPKIKIPMDPKELAVAIHCDDQNSRDRFRIGIKGIATSEVGVIPKSVVRRGIESEEIELNLIENFKDVQIADVALVTDGKYKIASREGSRLRLQAIGSAMQIIDEPILLQIKTKDGREVFLTIPVEATGVVRLTPSFVSFRKSRGGSGLLLMVSGLNKPVDIDSIDVAIPIADEKKLQGKVIKITMRTPTVAVIYVEFPDELVSSLFDENKHRELSVSVADRKANWTCQSRLISGN